MSQKWRIYLSRLSQNFFTMVEENFGVWWSKMPKNEGFEPFISAYLHHGWRNFCILMIWNAQEWWIWTTYLKISSLWLKKILDYDDLKCPIMKDLKHLSQNIFTMVEENFRLWWSKMPHNEGFEALISEYLHHGWRKFWMLVMQNAQEFEPLISECLHRGWRKFWILMTWNVLE